MIPNLIIVGSARQAMQIAGELRLPKTTMRDATWEVMIIGKTHGLTGRRFDLIMVTEFADRMAYDKPSLREWLFQASTRLTPTGRFVRL